MWGIAGPYACQSPCSFDSGKHSYNEHTYNGFTFIVKWYDKHVNYNELVIFISWDKKKKTPKILLHTQLFSPVPGALL